MTLSLPVKRPQYGGYCATSCCACTEHTSGQGTWPTSLPVTWLSSLPVTWLSSLPVTWIPVAPCSTSGNMAWAVPIYYFWAILFGPFGLIAPKTLNWLAIQSFYFENSWWRLFQKRVARTQLYIYFFIIMWKVNALPVITKAQLSLWLGRAACNKWKMNIIMKQFVSLLKLTLMGKRTYVLHFKQWQMRKQAKCDNCFCRLDKLGWLVRTFVWTVYENNKVFNIIY